MSNINIRKRAEHRRQVQEVLGGILNDPAVMPNVDCADLIVLVSHVEFGRTVREIYVRFFGYHRRTLAPGEERPHVRYQREADLRNDGVYDDLADVIHNPKLFQLIAVELQKRLGLLYTPEIRWLQATRTDDGENMGED
ncbi:hypothetical protein [Zavarzinella formosa]|uniref:hypothetical protein n=1 Tax=Zavarzinella formosa TaxID=360055 RepID=UPI0003002D54|nr:hypothetical protein [Zavarzinella formosa]